MTAASASPASADDSGATSAQPAPRSAPAAALVRPGRVFRATDPDAPSPTPAARPELHRDEDPDLVRARRLLCELRPERTGPYGAGPTDTPTLDARPSPTRVVVQTSGSGGGLPSGLFAVTPPRSPTALVTEHLARLEPAHPGEVAALRWLRSHGSLAQGLGPLVLSLGLALASAEQRARWEDRQARTLGASVCGRRALRRAAAVWWGEALPADR